jgi:hypothetical protein
MSSTIGLLLVSSRFLGGSLEREVPPFAHPPLTAGQSCHPGGFLMMMATHGGAHGSRRGSRHCFRSYLGFFLVVLVFYLKKGEN